MLIHLIIKHHQVYAPTAQLCVFANRLARPWMQYATSARGLVAEIAEKTAAKENKHKIHQDPIQQLPSTYGSPMKQAHN